MQALTPSSRRLLLAACASATLGFGVAQAQTTPPAPAPLGATAPAAAPLTIRDIYDRIDAAGYRDQREIEFDKGRYEIKARNAQGARVKLYVNARTGAIEHERLRD